MQLRKVYPALELQDYMFQAVIEYHPGDAQDKSTILYQIRTPGTSSTASDALTRLRRWKALEGIVSAPLQSDTNTGFRYSLHLHQLGLPELPTTDNVASLIRFAEAELKDMVAQGQGTRS